MIKWKFLTSNHERRNEPAKYTRHSKDTRHEGNAREAGRTRDAGGAPKSRVNFWQNIGKLKNKEDERKIAGANYMPMCKDNDK